MRFIISSRDFLLEHIAAVRSSVTLKSKVDVQNVRLLETELESLAKKHLRLSRIRIALFVLLYASVLSNFALPAVMSVVETFTLIANLVGVGILSLGALYLTWRLGQLWNRMTVLGSHIIAIYEKQNKSVYGARKGQFGLLIRTRN